ncbi:putative glutamine amidotransferase-like protein [Escovopsis weberi]|uniref:Putative glutamine amidotransferase-like protein n=1 Tax=Escovopsis weberi TaxID=150374 RepID=A0A0M8N2D6_ESCWE|nr:putative glutamine amidotransferase-like protein [Escovopsis weberi]
MSQSFRLAVLEAQTPLPNTLAARGSYGDIFRALLTDGLRNLGDKLASVDLQVSKWDVHDAQTYPDIDEVDGILISGSTHNAYDNDPEILRLLDFVRDAYHTARKPIIGICFGHQLVGRMLGAKVGVNPRGWELSVQTIHLSDRGRDLIGLPSIDIHQFHRDIVFDVPDGLLNLGSSPVCENQAFYQPGRILTFQGHPEFDASVTTELLGIPDLLDEKQIERALETVDRQHSGAYLAVKMIEFLLS